MRLWAMCFRRRSCVESFRARRKSRHSAAASVGNRAPAVLRRREQRRFPSASDDEVGGSNARDARAAQEIVARAGIEPATFHFFGERYYRASHLAVGGGGGG